MINDKFNIILSNKILFRLFIAPLILVLISSCSQKIANKEINDSSKLAAKLVHDHYYDSCYLYDNPDSIDHNYTYVIWTGDNNDIWISCYDQYKSENVFVLTPDKIIERYKRDEPFTMEYTKFAEGETRSNEISHWPTGYD